MKISLDDIVTINGKEYIIVDESEKDANGAIFKTRKGGISKFAVRNILQQGLKMADGTAVKSEWSCRC